MKPRESLPERLRGARRVGRSSAPIYPIRINQCKTVRVSLLPLEPSVEFALQQAISSTDAAGRLHGGNQHMNCNESSERRAPAALSGMNPRVSPFRTCSPAGRSTETCAGPAFTFPIAGSELKR